MDKKQVLAFVLIFIIIMVMPYYYKTFNIQAPGQSNEHTEQIDSTTTVSKINPNTGINTAEKKATAKVNATSGSNSTFDFVENEIYIIDTEYYKATLSNKGGGTLTSFILKKYNMFTDNDTTLVELLNPEIQSPLLLSYISIENEGFFELDQNFKLTQSSSSPNFDNIFNLNNDAELILEFSLLQNGFKKVTKTFRFYGDQYPIQLTTDMTGLLSDFATNSYKLNWDGGLSYTEPMRMDEIRYSKAYGFSGGETETFNIKSGKTNKTTLKGSTDWTAIRTKYFTACFIPETPGLGYELAGTGIPTHGKEFLKQFSMGINFESGTKTTTNIYIGPLEYSIIKTLSPDLENIMSLGKILRPICKSILWLFHQMYKVIPNYGWVLILFSILIKVVLSPLTNKSTQSMKEMQKVQPELAILKEKYKDDMGKYNKAQMDLFKEHGVNPMGGCFPLLLQMPILFSLFTVFRSTIDLRHADFIFWITDLSAPDTIFTLPFTIPIYGNHVNILPLVMAISMIFQQKLSGASSNPQQKTMMYMMPVMFFFMFNNFPSGLNLYYTLFNILSMVQQKYFTPEIDLAKKKKKIEEKKRKAKDRMDMMKKIRYKRR